MVLSCFGSRFGPLKATTTLLLCAAACTAHALDPWQTVDTLPRGMNGPSMAADGQGNVYLAGVPYSSPSPFPYTVLRGKSNGKDWEAVLTVRVAGANGGGLLGWSVGADSQGHLFLVSGSSAEWTDPGASHWIVRRSTDHGTNWTVVDDYVYDIGFSSTAKFFSSNQSGHCYVVGHALTGDIGTAVNPVRRSLDGGETWTTAGIFPPRTVAPQAILATENAVYVAGSDFSGDQRWVVWRSTDQGENWKLVDSFYSGTGAAASSLAADAGGNVYAVGTVLDVPKGWIVRRSSNGGTDWSTVDEVGGGGARVVTTDSSGSVFVFGAGWGESTACRVSRDGGSTWTTSDNLLHGLPYAATCDIAGNIYAFTDTAEVRRLANVGPALSVKISGATLNLSWPTNPNGFVLQSATTLSSGGNWQDSNLTPTIVGEQNVVTVNPTGSSGFFRLRKP